MLNRFLAWFVSTKMWIAFARHWMGHFTFRVFGYTKFPLEKYFEILNIFNQQQDGLYGFVSADTSSLSFIAERAFTKCKYAHAGFIRKEGDHLFAWHMKGDGLNHWHLLKILHECDRFALLKLPIVGETNIAIAKSRLDAILTDPLVDYNYSFAMPTDVLNWLTKGEALTSEEKDSLQNLKMYCSEMVYIVGVGLASNPKFIQQWTYGRKVFEPDHLYDASEILFEHT